MPSRTHLSEEAETEERNDRDRLRQGEAKLRDLRSRRQLLLQQVYQLSDEQKALVDQRAPRQDNLERTHAEHRSLSRDLAELRHRRDAARAQLDDALAEVRLARQAGPPGDRSRPDQIRREMAQLELKQQTTALPLADENALIDRLRQLRKQLDDAEKHRGAIDQHEQRVRGLEEALKARRADFDRLGEEMARCKVERDRRMTSMRAQLVEVGALVGGIREKAKARGEVMAKVDALSRQVFELERELRQIFDAGRQRRQEARRTIQQYNRGVRDSLTGDSATTQQADQQLEELLRRGKITLGG